MKNLTNLRCQLVQAQLCWADADANRRRLEAVVRGQGVGCDLVVFPETFTTGFLGDAETGPEPMNGETLSWMVP